MNASSPATEGVGLGESEPAAEEAAELCVPTLPTPVAGGGISVDVHPAKAKAQDRLIALTSRARVAALLRGVLGFTSIFVRSAAQSSVLLIELGVVLGGSTTEK